MAFPILTFKVALKGKVNVDEHMTVYGIIFVHQMINWKK